MKLQISRACEAGFAPSASKHYLEVMDKVTCACGAVYRETEHKLTMRDKDSAKCRLCGATLNTWNGAVMYTYELISTPEVQKP